MTGTERPEGTAGGDEPAESPRSWVPVTGVDALYTAALSGVIRDIQRSIAPALRVRIPPIPASAFKLPPIQLPQMPRVEVDFFWQFAAIIEPVLRAQREQLTKVMAGVDTAVQRIYPKTGTE